MRVDDTGEIAGTVDLDQRRQYHLDSGQRLSFLIRHDAVNLAGGDPVWEFLGDPLVEIQIFWCFGWCGGLQRDRRITSFFRRRLGLTRPDLPELCL